MFSRRHPEVPLRVQPACYGALPLQLIRIQHLVHISYLSASTVPILQSQIDDLPHAPQPPQPLCPSKPNRRRPTPLALFRATNIQLRVVLVELGRIAVSLVVCDRIPDHAPRHHRRQAPAAATNPAAAAGLPWVRTLVTTPTGVILLDNSVLHVQSLTKDYAECSMSFTSSSVLLRCHTSRPGTPSPSAPSTAPPLSSSSKRRPALLSLQTPKTLDYTCSYPSSLISCLSSSSLSAQQVHEREQKDHILVNSYKDREQSLAGWLSTMKEECDLRADRFYRL